MKYVLNSLSYDFGQRRGTASIQSAATSGNQAAFVSVNFAAEAPAHISAEELNVYLINEVRRQLQDASGFDLAPGFKK